MLWTNSNPNSNFAAQTISLDLTNYKYVIVISKTGSSYDFYPRHSSLVPVTSESSWCNVGIIATSSLAYVRNVKASSSEVIFEDTKNKGEGTANSFVIPLYIYGVKSDLGLWNCISGN